METALGLRSTLFRTPLLTSSEVELMETMKEFSGHSKSALLTSSEVELMETVCIRSPHLSGLLLLTSSEVELMETLKIQVEKCDKCF